MQNTFFTSNFSRRCSNGYTYTLNDGFCGHSFGYASQLPVCSISSSSSVSCCACCANGNLSICKVPVTPVYLCGLRQSTLIQYAPCKRVVFSGLDRVVSGLPGWGVGRRSSFEKGCSFREMSVGRSRKGWGKRRYRCMVYEDSGEELGIDDGNYDEAEVMLSLLTEEVGEECLGVRRRNGRQHKKVIVEETGYGAGANQCVTCGSKKKVGSETSRNRLRFECESAVNEVDRSEGRRKEEKKALLRRGHQRVSGRKEDRYEMLRGRLIKNEIDRTEERREEENKALLRRGHQRVSDRREDKDELLRESRKKEREGILIETYTQSTEKEYKEDFSGREEHKQRLRKDGSSCTSYYSLSSLGEYESNSGVQESQEFEEGLTSKFKRDSWKLEEIEIDGKAERQGGYQEEQMLVLKKGKRVEGNDLWQKQSEKKLTDMSTEETRLRKESDSRDDVSMKASYKKYEGQEEKATSMVKSNEGRREQHRLTSDQVKQKTQTIKNYKQFKEHSEDYTQSSNTQKLDVRKTSSSGLISGTTQNNQEKNSTIVLSSVHDAKEKHYHHGRFSTQIDSRKPSQQLTDEVGIQRATISQRRSEHNIHKQEESSTSVYGSYHESIKNIPSNEGVGKSDSKVTMKKVTNSGRNDADQRSRRNYDSVVTPPSSQRVPTGALHAGSTSGLVIEEVGHDSSREDFEHETGQPLGYISHEDALGSADLLQKSSSYHVGEFMDKARHEMSSSETQQEKQTRETKTKHDLKQSEQQAAAKVVSGVSQLKEQHPSPSSGSKGPSVEMWDVDEPSNQEHPGAEVLDRNSADSVITKRTPRSLWNVMSDIVRFTWASRSTNQSQMSKIGGKNSPNQSTSSETSFSGNEPDENIQMGDKNRKGSITQESTSVKIPKEEKSRAQSQGGSSSSSSSKDQIQPSEEKALSYVEVSPSGASSGSNVPALGEGTSHQKSEVIVSDPSMAAGSSQSPAMRLRRSPYIVGESSSASGKVDSSGSGEIEQTGLPVSTSVSEISQSEGIDEQKKSRKFLRTSQVVKDRFEEWEEAYRLETEQRKTDEMFMREALVEARKAADSWEVPVGAVLVHDGKIIARGHNLVEELRDSTAHAEMICIREASKILRTWRLSETTLYVTLEPCAMCAGAILQARIDVIVWGAPNKLLGADGSWIRLFPNGEGENSTNPSDKAAAPVHPFHPNIKIRRNVLAPECADSMQQFFQRRRKKEKKQEPPRSRIPILNQSSKLLSKMHDAFHMMFCL